jgi:hypothetical protein
MKTKDGRTLVFRIEGGGPRSGIELTAGDGSFYRESGRWRYSMTGELVPGGRDLRMSSHPFRANDGIVHIPRNYASAYPELKWCLEYGRGSVLKVPQKVWQKRSNKPVGMIAPELHMDRLLDAGRIAHVVDSDSPEVAGSATRAWRGRR